MKKITLVIVFCISFTFLLAKIRNGYDGEMQGLLSSVSSIQSYLSHEETLSPEQAKNAHFRLKHLLDYASYYELTNELLTQLRILSPDLYDEIDNIKDKQGRPVDVHVKFISESQRTIPLSGATYFGRSSFDEDAHLSEYGENSVSTKIWIGSNALLLLYHELGHIKYVVPNLAKYCKAYTKPCRENEIDQAYIGHSPGDPSGFFANRFENKLRVDHVRYRKQYGKRMEPVLAILQRVRRNNHINFLSNPTMIAKE